VKIRLLVNLPRLGPIRLHLYCQPMGSYYLMVPNLRRDVLPKKQVQVRSLHHAQKYLGDSRYSLASSRFVSAWFADTTAKLTPSTTPPKDNRPTIEISAARNEKLSFQLILAPHIPFYFERISATALRHGEEVIPATRFEF